MLARSHNCAQVKPRKNKPVRTSKLAVNNETNAGHQFNYVRPIPSGSEDSELSESDGEDECDRVCAAQQNTKPVRLPKVSHESDTGRKTGKTKFVWKDQTMHVDPDNTRFLGSAQLAENFAQLKSPIDYFKYFVTNDTIQHICHQTTLYSAQERPAKPLSATVRDIEQFLGIALYMSIFRLPNCRSYWSPDFRIEKITDIMTNNRFEEVKRFIHFSDNSAEGSGDKLKKIRPIIDQLVERFKSVPMEENLSIDEQMVPFKGRSSIKQYNPKKPHKWGYKVYVLAGVSGYAYDLELYSGKQDNVPLPDEVDCGASGNVVIRLTRSVPTNVKYKVYFDNYFNSPDLQLFLAKRGILSLGTVRFNRVSQCIMMTDAELKKRGRGAFAEKVAVVDDIQIAAVRWLDNKPVNFLSTLIGSRPVGQVRRWSTKLSTYQQIQCPGIVPVYNRHMGGVDLLDSLVGLYRTRIRSKKWYHRIFFHFMDVVIVNSWLLYKRMNQAQDSSLAQKPMRLLEFKEKVAEALCRLGKDLTQTRKRGRPAAADVSIEQPSSSKKRKIAVPQPSSDIRHDNVGHWPKWSPGRLNCRRTGCTGTTRVICTKCKIGLCFNKNQDCFALYHSE